MKNVCANVNQPGADLRAGKGVIARDFRECQMRKANSREAVKNKILIKRLEFCLSTSE